MQNWEHVTFIMEKLHQRPTKSPGVDFSRVRLWTLDELSTLYCQSLFFSSVPMVELNAIFNRTCKNYLGKMVTVNQIKTGSISGVLVGGVPMTFHRVDTKNLATSVDDRFNYFVQVFIFHNLNCHKSLNIVEGFIFVEIDENLSLTIAQMQTQIER